MGMRVCVFVLSRLLVGLRPQGWHGVAAATLKMSFATTKRSLWAEGGVESSVNLTEVRIFFKSRNVVVFALSKSMSLPLHHEHN